MQRNMSGKSDARHTENKAVKVSCEWKNRMKTSRRAPTAVSVSDIYHCAAR